MPELKLNTEFLKKAFKIVLVVLALRYCYILIHKFLALLFLFQWDFRTYYFASKAYSMGFNPYDTELLEEIFNPTIELAYVYSPLTLYVFQPFLLLEYQTAFYLYLGIKCLVLSWLFYLWQQSMGWSIDVLFYPFCFLAFNATIYMDFRSGNVSLFEQLLLWLAFVSYLKRRFPLFCAFVLLAAAFKMTPILFLLLLCFCDSDKAKKYFFISLGVFLSFLLLTVLADPELSGEFLKNLNELDGQASERGRINPSSLALIQDLSRWVFVQIGVPVMPQVPVLLFLGVAAGVAFVSWKALSVLSSSSLEEKERLVLFLFCLAYALTLPRFKDYSYVLLLAPAYFILTRDGGFKASLKLLIFTVVSTPEILRGSSFTDYMPLAAACGAWGLYLSAAFGSHQVETGQPTQTELPDG